jgi:hypothetical protein
VLEKGRETPRNAKQRQNHQHQFQQKNFIGAQFIGIRDSRNRRVPGIYQRNGHFYAQLWVTREDARKTARRFPLLWQGSTL